MRARILVISLMLLAAACGGNDADTAPASTAADATTVAPSATEPAADATSPAPQPEGPSAPDFRTILADGSEFDLRDHGRPVYFVIWEEW